VPSCAAQIVNSSRPGLVSSPGGERDEKAGEGGKVFQQNGEESRVLPTHSAHFDAC
jgi:hypothetical protein